MCGLAASSWQYCEGNCNPLIDGETACKVCILLPVFLVNTFSVYVYLEGSMQIKDVDKLKAWLLKKLEPL